MTYTKLGPFANGSAIPPLNAAFANGIETEFAYLETQLGNAGAALAAAQAVNPTNARNTITGWFHADAYGADKTGATDSAIPIQAALNAAGAAGGGTVYIPDGQYALGAWTALNPSASVSLQVPSNVRLLGTRNTTLNPTNMPTDGRNIVVIGTAQTSGVTGVTIEEIAIVDPSHATIGILIGANYGQASGSPVTRATVRGCRLYNNSIGIHIRDGSSFFEISGNHVVNPLNEGIQAQNCFMGEIIRNRIESSTGCNGIDISGENNGATDSACTYINVAHNIVNVTGAGSTGIFFETVAYCTCANNLTAGGAWGIYLNRINSEPIGNIITGNQIVGGANGAMILNNNVWDTTVTGNRFHVRGGTVGLDLNAVARGTIMGNVFFGSKTTTSYGIHSRNGSGNMTIVGNQFTYFANDIVLDSGSGAFLHYGNTTSNVTTPLAANTG